MSKLDPAEWTPLHELSSIAMPILLQNALEHEITFDGYDTFDDMIAEQSVNLAKKMLQHIAESGG